MQICDILLKFNTHHCASRSIDKVQSATSSFPSCIVPRWLYFISLHSRLMFKRRFTDIYRFYSVLGKIYTGSFETKMKSEFTNFSRYDTFRNFKNTFGDTIILDVSVEGTRESRVKSRRPRRLQQRRKRGRRQYTVSTCPSKTGFSFRDACNVVLIYPRHKPRIKKSMMHVAN